MQGLKYGLAVKVGLRGNVGEGVIVFHVPVGIGVLVYVGERVGVGLIVGVGVDVNQIPVGVGVGVTK